MRRLLKNGFPTNGMVRDYLSKTYTPLDEMHSEIENLLTFANTGLANP